MFRILITNVSSVGCKLQDNNNINTLSENIYLIVPATKQENSSASLIQINFIFSDNVHILYIYSYSLRLGKTHFIPCLRLE